MRRKKSKLPAATLSTVPATLTRMAALLAASLALPILTGHAQVQFVDPTIGGQAFMLEPTRPTVSMPNGMVRFHPVRADQLDDQIKSFPLSIISHRLGELFRLMPAESADPAAWDRPAAWDQEKCTPYFYSTRFDDSLIRTEFAPTERTGYFRFSFPTEKAAVLLANRQGGELSSEGNSISGFESFSGQSELSNQPMKAYVHGEFRSPVHVEKSADGKGTRLSITPADGARVLEFRYGISFISVEQAKQNLARENSGWNFDAIASAAEKRWNTVLGRIALEGGTEAQKRVFYTSLYRAFERMVNISEDGKYYSAFDHRVHEDERPFYTDNWLWDTYRALQPLQTLLDPSAEADKIQSYVRMYEQSGWMPSFAVLWGNHECMTGNPAAIWFADALAKGVTNFDLPTAYAGVRKNSLEGTWLPWRRGPKSALDDKFAELGYLPALRPGEAETDDRVNPRERRQAISVTEAQSYDDWATAQLALALGKNDDARLFLKRAANYRNLFRADKGHVWPKDADGNWIEGFEPGFSGGQGGRDYTTENNGYTYDWDVQHDLHGLIELMGGRQAAEAKLDRLFREGLGRSKYKFWFKFPDASGLVGQFSMGNEPSLHIPYIYNYLGAPWKTQKRVRMLLDTWFTDTLLGMPGDEDGGGMTAFVVFSMIGIYPVTPGLPVYTITSPVFDVVTITPRGGKPFTIRSKNNSRDNKYIQSLELNGHPLEKLWITHAEIMAGGTLTLHMGDTPNRKLGTDPAAFPPSSLDVRPSPPKK